MIFALCRTALFWLVFAAILAGFDWLTPWFSLEQLDGPITVALAGNVEALSQPAFVFALAWTIVASAAGFAVSFLLLHVAWIGWRMWRLRRVIAASTHGNASSFAQSYETLRERLRVDGLIGHAFGEFDKTVVRDHRDLAVATARPQAFINPSLARDRYAGLKFMSALPGYFVGIGLLLTFVGLVLALGKAGEAAAAADVGGMQKAVGDLLQVATFKFATSIAGLGMSILLAIVFRAYSIAIDGFFHRFCRALEKPLLFRASQSIALEMNETMKEQRDQLKEITQGDFFARMGAEIAPRFEQSLRGAFEPVSQNLELAISEMRGKSENGLSSLIQEFSSSVQAGAGTEMRELAGTLARMQDGLTEMQAGLRGTGEDFGRRMSDAAENLSRMVQDAGAALGRSSTDSRDALTEVVGALRATMETANSQIAQALGTAADGASSKLENAMGRVLERLQDQVDGFSTTLANHQSGFSEGIRQSAEQVAAAQRQANDALGSLSNELAQTLRAGMSETMAEVTAEFAKLVGTLRSLEGNIQSQARAIEATTSESRKTADVFNETSATIRSATQPLRQVGERFENAGQVLGASLAAALDTIRSAQSTAETTARALGEAQREVSGFWARYAENYRGIDQDLGRAVETLSKATTNHQQVLDRHVASVDKGLGEAVGKLQGLLETLNDNAESLGHSVDAIERSMRPQAAE